MEEDGCSVVSVKVKRPMLNPRPAGYIAVAQLVKLLDTYCAQNVKSTNALPSPTVMMVSCDLIATHIQPLVPFLKDVKRIVSIHIVALLWIFLNFAVDQQVLGTDRSYMHSL